MSDKTYATLPDEVKQMVEKALKAYGGTDQSLRENLARSMHQVAEEMGGWDKMLPPPSLTPEESANLTLEDYLMLVDADHKDNPDWRYGQTLFNTLHRVRPDLSEQVRGTPLDTFYVDGVEDPRASKFFDWLHINW